MTSFATYEVVRSGLARAEQDLRLLDKLDEGVGHAFDVMS